jgi:hypothetical protein
MQIYTLTEYAPGKFSSKEQKPTTTQLVYNIAAVSIKQAYFFAYTQMKSTGGVGIVEVGIPGKNKWIKYDETRRSEPFYKTGQELSPEETTEWDKLENMFKDEQTQ